MNQHLYYDIALSFVPNVGSVAFKQLINYAQTAKAVFEMPKGKLLQIPHIGEKIANSILQRSTFEKAEQELRLAEKNHVQILSLNSEAYPIRLRNIYDSPALLYIKGQIPKNEKIIAVVGTRKATEYGKNITDRFVEGLLPYNPLIVSGLAYGIDIQAHRKALQIDLPTLGVMATGIDTLYPLEHQQTAAQMLENGGLITEYPFGTKPDAMRFPERNRIIAGMADAVLVVEAAAKGGALITAECANEYSREVFAVPNKVDAKYSAGCNQLIRNHKAHLITDIEELALMMGWKDKKTAKKHTKIAIDLNEDEQKIVEVLHKKSPIHIDELAWQSQITIHQTSVLLLELEFKGVIKQLAGKRFALN